MTKYLLLASGIPSIPAITVELNAPNDAYALTSARTIGARLALGGWLRFSVFAVDEAGESTSLGKFRAEPALPTIINE